jgi:hypothetical protein
VRTVAFSWRTHTGRTLADALISRGIACESSGTGRKCGVTNGVPYAIGGENVESRRELVAIAPAFSVMLVFARDVADKYLANVDVSVRDCAGAQVLGLDRSGPIVLLGLAPGEYRVEVDHDGKRHVRPLAIGAQSHRQVVFFWRTESDRGRWSNNA